MEKKTFTAEEVAKIAGGQLAGDPSARISGIASLRDAGPEDLSFLSNRKYCSSLETTKAAAVIAGKDVAGRYPGRNLIVCENPNIAFSKAIALFAPPAVKFPPGIAPGAYVSPSAKLGAGVHVGHNAVIEDGACVGDGTSICAGAYVGHECRIGCNTLIYPNVCIRERCIVGDRVVIHCGAVIGADGFGFEAGPAGIVKIEQVGIVEIQSDVEIGANTTIDRARFGRTLLKRGVKVDNLVQIAHNVVVGEFSMLIGQSGVAGSTEIGRGAILAAQGGIAGHLHIGDGAKIAGQSGVTKDIPPGQAVVGTPAESPKEFMERVGLPVKLRKVSQTVAALERRIADLENEMARLKGA